MRTEDGALWRGGLPLPSFSPTADSAHALPRRTEFERAEGSVIKPDTYCVDIGLFTVEKAHEAAHLTRSVRKNGSRGRADRRPLAKLLYELHAARFRIGKVPFAGR